jgi:hypothetical protein
MTPESLSSSELFWLFSLVFIFALDFLSFVSRRDRLAVYQPPVFVMLFMSYYCIVGPLQRLFQNDWIHVLKDFRFAAVYGWAGAVVFYLSLRLGYGLFRGWRPVLRFAPSYDEDIAFRYGSRLCWLGLFLFSLANGLRVLSYLNPFNVTGSAFFEASGLDLGPFKNYFDLGINLLVPGILLQYAGWRRSRKRLLPWLLWTLVSVAIFTSLGFRWRIVVLLVPMVLLWFLARGRRPAIFPLLLSASAMVGIAGLIEQTRSYGVGLNIGRASDFTAVEILQSGFNDSNVFLVTGGLIAGAPQHIPFVGFSPIISALLFPIPSSIWQEKATFDYLYLSMVQLFSSYTLGLGQATLNYGEYYLMFGWWSVVAMGLLSGWLLRCLWNWFSPRRGESLAQVAYLCTSSLLYIWVSRGYLSQFLFSLAVGSLPLFWFYYRNARIVSAPASS